MFTIDGREILEVKDAKEIASHPYGMDDVVTEYKITLASGEVRVGFYSFYETREEAEAIVAKADVFQAQMRKRMRKAK